jgi:DNA-binding winged helix-turn-helix (wHTH) protein/tetratricopeptide (TPR) repeat protein
MEPPDGMTSTMSPPAATSTTRPLVSSAPTGRRVASRRSVPGRVSSLTTDKEFPPFRLDTTNQCLWRRRDSGDEERILLRPKSYAVLSYLVERAGRLVTEDELLDAVWPEACVEPQAVKSSMFDVRRALGDTPKNPMFIETLSKRGYRFIAQVGDPAAKAGVGGEPRPSMLVGRQKSSSELRDCQQRALRGERQIVFVSGEAGIGKTALVDEFEKQARQLPGIVIARGQCIEGYGGKEAYYPMLEALRELCRGPIAQLVTRALSISAPTWLIQFPSLVLPEHRDLLQREILGATRERMLREISEALESITAQITLMLVFEDLHWADDATVDLISAFARARGPAKLMLLGTVRPTEIALSQHPLTNLKCDLSVHKLCHEIELQPLSESDIAEYLTAQSQGATLPTGLVELIYRHSEGNPLFMVAAIQHMTQRGFISMDNRAWHLAVSVEEIEPSVPENLRHMIEAQVERLSTEEQRLLEVAAVAGVMFSSACVAAAAQMDEIDVEDVFENLCRRHLILRTAGSQTFEGGIVSQRWEFVHALYRTMLYERIGPGRRARIHRQIGGRLESLLGGQSKELSAELARHFEASGDWSRAVQYLRMSAATDGQRFAHREAAATLEHALVLSRKIAGTQGVMSQMDVLKQLAGNDVVSFDTLPRALETYNALVALARRHGLIDVEARTLVGMAYPLSWSNARSASEVIERALRLGAGQADAVPRARTRARCLVRRIWVTGWNEHDAEDFHSALAEIRRDGDREIVAEDLLDCSHIRWISAQYREAHRNVVKSLELLTSKADQNPHLSAAYQRIMLLLPFSLLFLGEWGQALRELDAAIKFAEKNVAFDRARAFLVYRGWVHLHAMDFTGVLAIGEKVLPSLKHPVHSPWRRVCLIFMASAETALGQHERAFERQAAVREEMDRQPVVFDWYIRMLLESCLTEVLLANGDLAGAKGQAERFVDAALRTAERTWQALAWEASARVAMAENELGSAGDCIRSALTSMEGFELPLADWRVHATAADVYSRAGNIARAKQLRELSRTTILNLANSLSTEEALQKTFLSAPSVRSVLEHGY